MVGVLINKPRITLPDSPTITEEVDDEPVQRPPAPADIQSQAADVETFDRTYLARADGFRIDGRWSPAPLPLQVIPRVAYTINYNFVWDESRERWVPKKKDRVLDDFEDQDTTVIPDNWTGWTTTNIADLSVTSTRAISGDFSGLASTSGDSGDQVRADRNSPFRPDSFSCLFRPTRTLDTGEGVFVQLRRAGTNVINLEFRRQSGERVLLNGATDNQVGTWTVDKTYEIQFNEIDFTAGTFTLRVVESISGVVVVDLTDEPMQNNLAVDQVVFNFDWDVGDPLEFIFDVPDFRPGL